MRHVFECPLRWADMDLLGHVNNVTYLDYLQEARIAMFAEHAPFRGGEELAEGVVVVRHEVDYLAPLVFRAAPVRIDCWVTRVRAASFALSYEIYDEAEDGTGRRVYLRATSVLAPYVFATERPRRITAAEKEVLEQFLEPAEPRPALGDFSVPERTHRYPLVVRWSDVDAYRHVNNVKYYEYLQESRIQLFAELAVGAPGQDGLAGDWPRHVVARTDVDYLRPILFRLEEYAVFSWISRVGTSSFTIAAEIRDGDTVLARGHVVMVVFDSQTQRSRPMPDAQRAVLTAELES